MEVKIGSTLMGVGSYVRYADKSVVFVPAKIPARIDGAKWTIEFTVSNTPEHPTPVISELRITMKSGGEPITPGMVRGIKLGDALKQAVALASTPLTVISDDDVPLHEADFFLEPGGGNALSNKQVFSKPKGTVKLDEIRRAADLYRAIKADPSRRDTIMGVAKELNLTRSTAHRRIQRARQLGILGGDE